MPSLTHHERYAVLNERGEPFVAVTLVDAHGSTPADAGARMIVRASGHDHGTVGGGKIEARAIQEAQAMLEAGPATRFFDWNLASDIGMTCGGRVRLFFERVDRSGWRVVIFGAGHVTQALARVLEPMACRVTCVDPRPDWLGKLPEGVEAVRTDDPPSYVHSLPDAAHVLCMTRGHAADRPVLQRIFEAGRRFAFLGVIGSDAKAATLRRELQDAGVNLERIDFRCPIGMPLGSNHPAEIAVSIAAELLQVRDAAPAEPA
ncbi:MAG: xanthine dehydrogenase accessory protein XdhC [Planctomycetota bacterium]